MEKHENMVKKNKERSKKKIEKACIAIRKMLKNDEQVVVKALVKRTDLSRAFFYNNEVVRVEMKRAQELQEGKSFVTQQKVIIDKSMEAHIDLLKKNLSEKDVIIASQKNEIAKLKKSLENKALKTLQEL